MAADLVRRGVNVIVTGGTPATLAAKAATTDDSNRVRPIDRSDRGRARHQHESTGRQPHRCHWIERGTGAEEAGVAARIASWDYHHSPAGQPDQSGCREG